MKLLIYSILMLSLISCESAETVKKYVNITFSNASNHALDWVKLEIGKRKISAGILITGSYKTSGDVAWWDVADRAKITFVDADTRQAYAIEVSLKAVNELVKANKAKEITIRIDGYDKAEILSK